MSDAAFILWLVVLLIVAIFLFDGTPDIADALNAMLRARVAVVQGCPE